MSGKKIPIDTNLHHTTLLHRLNGMRDTKDHCDFTIKVGSMEISAHKNIVSAGSDYFAAMLSHDTKERQTGIVEIKEAEATCIKKCIDFIYTGMPPDMDDDIEQLLYAAHLLNLTLLSDGIIRYLENEMSLKSFKLTLKLANLYDSKKLVENCNAFAEDNFEAITTMEDFVLFDKNFVEKMLTPKQDETSCVIKLDALLRWIKFDLEKRKKHLNKLLKKINLSKVPAEFLRNIIENEPLINKDTERLKLFSLSALDNMSVIAKTVDEYKNEKAIAIFDNNSGYIQCFNPTKNTWTQMHEMDNDMKRDNFSAICIDNYIYVFKKDKSVHRLKYVDESAEWEHVGDTIDDHGCCPPVVAVKDCIYVVGGYGSTTKSVEKYVIHSTKFIKLPDKQHKTNGSTPVVSNDKIHSCGGYVDYSATNIVEYFDPDNSTWAIVTSMNESRGYAAAVELNDKLYIVGGWNGNNIVRGWNGNKCICTVECYDPTTAKWSVLKPMNTARAEFRCFIIKGCFYAIGSRKQRSTIEKYDPAKNQWTDVAIPAGLNLCILESVKINLKP